MFDLEGMPPRLDELEKIYIWGLQVFGENAGPFRPAVAGFGPRGDRDGWFAFLDECQAILDEYGDIPFVHWATYEQVKLDMYITRYGDPDGIAARVKANLLDLLPITRASVAVPVSSYSLKDVETVAGYERQLEEYGGSWSMAKYIEATECIGPRRARRAASTRSSTTTARTSRRPGRCWSGCDYVVDQQHRPRQARAPINPERSLHVQVLLTRVLELALLLRPSWRR